jgi:hypothetical protein
MRFIYLILLSLLHCHLGFANLPQNGIILYANVFKQKPFKDGMFDNFKQPDSIFYLVQYNINNCFFFFNTPSHIATEIKLNDYKSYCYINGDLNYRIESFYCNTYYKMPLHSAQLNKTNQTIKVTGIVCKKYFTVNEFSDTTIYFLTSELPKTAGVCVFSNIKECIIGIEDKNNKIFPIAFHETKKPLIFNTVNKIQEIKSTAEVWMDGVSTNIYEGKDFPVFKAKGINDKIINNNSLKSNYSIFIIFDHIKECIGHYFSSEKMANEFNDSNQELLTALNGIAKEKKANGFVITNDYMENIPENSYHYLHIIPNSAVWRQKVQINTSPIIIITNKSGIVVKYITSFDLNPSTSIKSGLLELLN